MFRFACLPAAAVVASVGGPASAGIVEFYFAPVGNSFSAFMSGDDPLVGKEIVSTRIYLNVESYPGSDAANFWTDIALPIQPFDGNTNFVALFGDDLGWSGSGVFSHFVETTDLNGHFIATRWGGETPGFDFQGEILEGSRIEIEYVPAPGALVAMGVGLLVTFRRRRI